MALSFCRKGGGGRRRFIIPIFLPEVGGGGEGTIAPMPTGAYLGERKGGSSFSCLRARLRENLRRTLPHPHRGGNGDARLFRVGRGRMDFLFAHH